MLNKNIAFVLVYIICLGVLAQQQTKPDSLRNQSQVKQVKTLLSVGVGASIPVSDFGLKDINNTSSGFANFGYNINASLAWIMKRGLGVGFMYRYQSNDIDKQSLISQYVAKYPNIKWDISSTPWKTNAFLVGPCSTTPIGNSSKRTFLDAKLMLGLVRSTSFGMIVTGTQGGNSASATSPATAATAFGYCIGLGIRHEVAHDIYIGFNLDFFESAVNYGNVTLTTPNGSATNSESQKISTANLFLNLIIRID